VDVLRHVPVEELQRLCIGRIPTGEFVILGTSEFRILPPKVFFYLFEACKNLKIAMSPLVMVRGRRHPPGRTQTFACQHSGTQSRSARCYCSLRQE